MRASRNLRELNAKFMAKVAVVHDANSCWEWQGTTPGDYGMFWVPAWLAPDGRSRMHPAHRIAHWLATGEWPGPRGNDVCHSCDNPICVRPSHLWLGTHHENMLDAKRKGRISRQGAPAGEASPLHRLSDNDIAAIALRAHSGERQGDIAADYGISQSMVSRIKTGERRGIVGAGAPPGDGAHHGSDDHQAASV